MFTINHSNLLARYDITDMGDGFFEQEIDVRLNGRDYLLTICAHAIDGPLSSWFLACSATGDSVADHTGALRSRITIDPEIVEQLSTELYFTVADELDDDVA